MRAAALWLLVACCGVGLIAWNASRFHGVDAKPRTKELDFLPSPLVARLLALGHASTVAKLRWIDSFAYFELQLDKRDDSLVGGGAVGGFQRLYDTLIELDPKFRPFYEHAAMCTSGLLNQHRLALGYLERGTLELPHDTVIWRNLCALLYAHFELGDRQPDQFDRILSTWDEMEQDPVDKMAIRVWKENLGKRKFAHLEQLPYWFDRLLQSAPQTPMGDYVEGVVREQLGRYGLAELQALAEIARTMTGVAPTTLGQLCHPLVVASRYGRQGPPEFAPIAMLGDGSAVLWDPWGYDFAIAAGVVRSVGLDRVAFDARVALANNLLDNQRRSGIDAPRSLDDVATATRVDVREPPAGGVASLVDGHVVVAYAPPPHPPYPVRELAAADAREQRDALRSALAAPHR